MRHFAVVGSGPAGFYTAEALEKAYGDSARIDILDRYPVPYGLIRFGVAPDHQSLKAVSKRYDKVAESAGRRLHRQCRGRPRRLGRRAARPLRRRDPRHRRAARPQARHSRARTCRAWSARPSSSAGTTAIPISPTSTRRSAGAHAAVIGNGNVALDCARILSKTRHEFEGSDIVGHALDALDTSAIRTITILGRRGPHQIAMTPKELGELGHLEAAVPIVDLADFPPRRGRRRARARASASRSRLLRGFADLDADKPKRMVFDFFAKPVADRRRRQGRADHRRAHRARRERRRARHRRDLRGAGLADRHRIGYSTLADRRRSL